MFKNYLKITLRNLTKYKGYSFINIAGLAIGMAACILILLFVIDEVSFDKYHENANNIYRLERAGFFNGEDYHTSSTAHPHGAGIVNEYPEVKASVRFSDNSLMMKNYQNEYFEEIVYFTDENLFDVFSYKLLQGDPNNVLVEPNTVILTQEMAEKYFGKENPMGKILQTEFENTTIDFKVTGILEEIPKNSSYKTKFFASYSTMEPIIGVENMQQWLSNSIKTFLLLEDNVDVAALEQKLPDLFERHIGATVRAMIGEDADLYKIMHFVLTPLTDLHLYSKVDASGSITTVITFSIIAFLTLLIACINFMNLATARSTRRAKEVGVRKSIGANRKSLLFQFLGESVIMSVIASVFALILVLIILPSYNAFTLKNLSLATFSSPLTILYIVGIVLGVGVLAGIYPAFYLSSFQPVKVLKASASIGKSGSSAVMRKGLVLLQFAISIVLIAATLVVSKQLNFIRNKDLGFNKEHTVLIPIADPSILTKTEAFKQELKGNSNIVAVTAAHQFPGRGGNWDSVFHREGGPDGDIVSINFNRIDEDYLEVTKIKLLAGRMFNKEFGTDEKSGMIINEQALQKLGWDTPVEAIGQGIMKPLTFEPPVTYERCEVVGVIQDYNFHSLHHKIMPLLLHFGTMEQGPSYFGIRIKPENIPATLNHIKNVFNTFSPAYPFEYYFLDDNFNRHYRVEERIGSLFRYFTFLTIFIACLGLFGLASFSAEQRTKEIGIRKVLGASTPTVTYILIKEFTKWVIISNIIAIPIAWFAMNKWLQSFAYKTNISLWIFVVSAIAAFTVAIVTVSYQAVKTATSNPVKALKYE